MPATLELRENGHLVWTKFTDPWTLAELETIGKEERNLRDNSKEIIHSLVDVREMKRIPPGLINVARRMPILNHPTRGHMVVVGASAFATALVETLIKITRATKIKFFKTEEEAVEYIRKVIAEEAPKTEQKVE